MDIQYRLILLDMLGREGWGGGLLDSFVTVLGVLLL